MSYPSSTLAVTCEAIQSAGLTLRERFNPAARLDSLDALLEAVAANERAVVGRLESALLTAVPGSTLLDDAQPLHLEDDGYGWVIDAVEGNVNHCHGRDGWAVTACLVRGREPVLAAAYVPLSGSLLTAVAGEGAEENGHALHVAGKRELRAALVGTAQARPFENAATHAAMTQTFGRMLDRALLVRTSVPSTPELIDVACGRLDAFWQLAGVASGMAAGALFITEAGGVVTDMEGKRWRLGSDSLLASNAFLHGQALLGLRGDA